MLSVASKMKMFFLFRQQQVQNRSRTLGKVTRDRNRDFELWTRDPRLAWDVCARVCHVTSRGRSRPARASNEQNVRSVFGLCATSRRDKNWLTTAFFDYASQP